VKEATLGHDITDTEARLALGTIEHRRSQVIDEIDLPRWYWWGVGLGWIALGVITDLGHPWLTLAATFLFGAVHSAIAQRVLSGRHGSRQLSVRADVVSRRIPFLVIGFLLAMAAVTVGLALLANADGADHPATIASVIVAVGVICGGPNLMAAVRRRAQRDQRPLAGS
jgi:hypothetical protein